MALVGHSNGGLVSRYYIENMGGSINVEKLITIDTPHWGSGLADISDNLTTCMPMDFDLNMVSFKTFGEYEANIKNGFIENSKYSELASNIYFKNVFDLKSSDGDNVVNNQSQLGVKFEDDKNSSKLLKQIYAEKMWMNIDTF